jgi:ribulose-5-phosphate 4-epimerase/fuculose-1-phosphate aldolase
MGMNEPMEGYRGIVGFEPIPEGKPEEVVRYARDFGVFASMRNVARRLDELGWTPANAGNISIRCETSYHSFFITASGSDFSDISDDDIVHVDKRAVLIGDGKKPYQLAVGGGSADGITCMDFYPARIIQAMAKEGLLPEMERELGTDFLSRVPMKVLTGHSYKYGIGPYPSGMRWSKLNEEAEKAGLGLKTLVNYLRKYNLIRCVVTYIGSKEPSSETFMHGLVYKNSKRNVNAIVHCHAPGITGNPPEGIPVTETDQKEIGYGSLELAAEALEALGDSDCVILKGHGPIATSGSWRNWEEDESFGRVFRDALEVLKEADDNANKEDSF